MPGLRRGLVLALVATAIVLIDQLAKGVIVSVIGPGTDASSIDLMGDWLSLEYAENRGVAFGFFSELGPLLPWASLSIVAVLLVHYFRSAASPLWESVAIAAIAGGAIGNLIDRLRLGYVVDFISVGVWPNFNVADSAITVGVLIAVWGWVTHEPRRSTSQASQVTD